MAQSPEQRSERYLRDLLMRAARTAEANADYASGRGFGKQTAAWKLTAMKLHALREGQWYPQGTLDL